MLKIKNKKGEWTPIIALKGEKGDKGDKGEDAITDQKYDPKSKNAQSGIALKEGFDINVGDMNAVLAHIIAGSQTLSAEYEAILQRTAGTILGDLIAAEVSDRLAKLTIKRPIVSIEKLTSDGELYLEPNTAYLLLGDDNVCEANVYEEIVNGEETEYSPVNIVGKYIAVITDDGQKSGDALKVTSLIGSYAKPLKIKENSYVAIAGENKGFLKWNYTTVNDENTIVTHKLTLCKVSFGRYNDE